MFVSLLGPLNTAYSSIEVKKKVTMKKNISLSLFINEPRSNENNCAYYVLVVACIKVKYEIFSTDIYCTLKYFIQIKQKKKDNGQYRRTILLVMKENILSIDVMCLSLACTSKDSRCSMSVLTKTK
jgi:hypothetical protein